ncbi:HalOD1 output domain-containing protein [Natrinema sp. SYSU A 869]|uniref:HalOD1 output domain-containing protein n=1 Tax=Natrinema sp. SYSU A 869 TaxID=2871694 RepID=UPI001CA3F4E0|nr:HalOD1 output domain-containing protein [Natrinema sp. SYSU A 869]
MSQVTHHQEQSTPNLGAEIVEVIADREGTNPTQLSPPLHSVIDPDALNSLFQSIVSEDSHREGSVCFTYYGYEVQVDSDGNIIAELLDRE